MGIEKKNNIVFLPGGGGGGSDQSVKNFTDFFIFLLKAALIDPIMYMSLRDFLSLLGAHQMGLGCI